MAISVNLALRVPQATMKGLTKLSRWASSGHGQRGPTVAVADLPSGAPCSEVLLRPFSSSSDFSAAWLCELGFDDGMWATHLAEVIVLALALLDEVGQLCGQQLRRHRADCLEAQPESICLITRQEFILLR